MNLPEFEKHPDFVRGGQYRNIGIPECVQARKYEYNAIREALIGMQYVANENASLRLTVMSQAAAIKAAEQQRDALQYKVDSLDKQLKDWVMLQHRAEQQRDELRKAAKDYLEYDELACDMRYNKVLDALLEAIAKAGEK